jgi:amino acid transporter
MERIIIPYIPVAGNLIQKHSAVDLLEYVAVSAGMMFGASCYLVLGVIAGANSVRDIVLAIMIAAALCIAVALAVGEMASRFPSAPGIRTYLKRAFGDATSLFFTYLSLLVITLFAGIEVKVFLDALWPGTSPHARAAATGALMLFLGYLNLTGRELPRLAQVLAWAREGRIAPHVSHTFALDDIKAAMRAKWRGDVIGGCVVHP